jgi:hypothetical protein
MEVIWKQIKRAKIQMLCCFISDLTFAGIDIFVASSDFNHSIVAVNAAMKRKVNVPFHK